MAGRDRWSLEMIRGVSRRRSALGRIFQALAIIAIGAGLVYLIQFAEFVSVMFEVFSSINSATDAAKNQRGDKVEVSTELSGRLQDPDKTVVRLRRADHWFSTTLVETDSFGVQENLKWKNDDTLEVTLGFGCLTHMTQPINQVGSIQISYHFSDDDKTLAKGCPD